MGEWEGGAREREREREEEWEGGAERQMDVELQARTPFFRKIARGCATQSALSIFRAATDRNAGRCKTSRAALHVADVMSRGP